MLGWGLECACSSGSFCCRMISRFLWPGEKVAILRPWVWGTWRRAISTTWKHTFRYVVVTPWEVATPIFLNKKWHQERVRKVQEIHTPKLIGGASEGGVTELSGNQEESSKDSQTVYMEWGTLSNMTRTYIYQGQSSVIHILCSVCWEHFCCWTSGCIVRVPQSGCLY